MSMADSGGNDALVQAIVNGYADSEIIASTDLQTDQLPAILKSLQEDRRKVEAEVRGVSREVAPDVDGWIQQAKLLQVEIERSKVVAKEIVEQAEASAVLHQQHQDFERKCGLLQAEVEYTGRLEDALRNIRDVTNTLGNGREAAAHGDIEGALERVRAVDAIFVELRPLENTSVVELLMQRSDQFKATLVQDVARFWDAAVEVDHLNATLAFRAPVGSMSESQLSLDKIVDLSSELNILHDNIARSCRRITSVILKPRLEQGTDGQVAELLFESRRISVSGRARPSGCLHVLSDVSNIVRVLNSNLPPSTSVTLSESLMPPLVAHLLSYWLMPAIPTALQGLDDFQQLLQRVEQLAVELESFGWNGTMQLREWVEQGPKNWLGTRKEDALAAVRNTIVHGVQSTRTVQRVETQKLSQGDMLAAQGSSADDWDTNWSENPDEMSPDKTIHNRVNEDDFSAWDAADPSEQSHVEKAQNDLTESRGEAANDGEAWGWGEQDPSSMPSSPVAARKQPSSTNGDSKAKDTETHLTLKEVYTVTAVPDELRDIVMLISRDAETLRSQQYENSPIAPAAVALYTFPTLVLACFRALAPTFYAPLVGGNMFLYNDSMRLASELEIFASSQAAKDAAEGLPTYAWSSTRMKLALDISVLEGFSRRAYGKEMEAQRTILRDLLDGAQDFTNCTEPPFAAACEDAVKSVTDRVRDVCKQWSPILSRSALLQSLGSLLFTITSKIIVDVEDLSDISEAESQRLRQFCNEVSALSDLFTQENPSSPGETKDMTALYVQNWIKFQYLSEIMDSSLADIRYFWTETDLKLEFNPDELVDLIEALFSDTDHRRKAITEIRRR